MAYPPETNELAKRTNQWLEGFLCSFCNHQEDNWATRLPIAEFCHNKQSNSATGWSAFETIYGLHRRWDTSEMKSLAPEAKLFAEHIEKVWDKVRASMETHRTKESKPSSTYSMGDKVYLATPHLKTGQPSKRLDAQKIGPSRISKIISSYAYRLDLPKTMHIHNVFHVNLLLPFHADNDFHQRQIALPPIVTEEREEEYEVEKIVFWKRNCARLWYLVQWSGYGPEDISKTNCLLVCSKGSVSNASLQSTGEHMLWRLV